MEQQPSNEEKITPSSSWGFRHVVLFLSFFGSLISYVLRVNLSVAIVAMVNHTDLMKTAGVHSSSCVQSKSSESQKHPESSLVNSSFNDSYTDPYLGEKFDWDPEIQSIVLGALFYGVTVGQLPGGVLIQMYGIRWTFGVTTLIYSLLSLITPIAASWSATAVIAIRFIQGLLQGTQFPAMMQAVSRWLPAEERSKGFAFVFNGFQVGVIAGMFLSGVLVESQVLGGWPSVFYVFGAISCLYSILWLILVTDLPEQNQYTSKCEVEIIQSSEGYNQSESVPVPWKEILTSIPVWATSISLTGFILEYLLLLTELPLYLSNVLDFNIRTSGAISAAPYIAHCLMVFVGSYIADGLQQFEGISITTIRKLLCAIGLFGSSAFLASIALVGCNKNLVVALLCISSGVSGITVSGCQITAVDMSPTFTATISAINTTVGFFFGALVPYVVAVLTRTGQTLENWSVVFTVHAAVIALSGLQFLAFGSGERQSWDYPRSNDSQGCSNEAFEDENKKEESTRF